MAGEAAKDALYAFDFTVPTSPALALALAGLSQDKSTVQSSSLKPFVLSLPAVLSGLGGQSAAIDLSPMWLFVGEPRRLYSDYVGGSYWRRLAYRTRVNAAVYNGTNDKVDPKKARGSRLAFGFSASLLDASDPLMARGGGTRSVWQSCIDGERAHIGEALTYVAPSQAQTAELAGPLAQARTLSIQAPSGARPTAKQVADFRQASGLAIDFAGLNDAEATDLALKIADAIHAKIKKLEATDEIYAAAQAKASGLDAALKACSTRATNAAMAAPAASVGAGHLLRGEPGRLDGFRDGGTVLWSSLRVPLAMLFSDGNEIRHYLVAGAFVRRGFGEYLATGDAAVAEFRAHTWEYWGGLELSSQTLKLAAQLGRTEAAARVPTQDQFSKGRTRYLASGSVPILGRSTGIWLGASYGNSRSTVTTENDRTFLVTLDFAPSKAKDLFNLSK